MTDPVTSYQHALKRLADLEGDVAAGCSFDQVNAAMTDLKVAIVRAYGGQKPRHPRGQGAKSAILNHLTERIGDWVYGDELAAVSGIGEWARRVRELRVESGYDIEEQDGCYRLTHLDPDTARRDRWRTVTDLRDAEGTATQRIQLLLEELVGQPVTVDELDRVARSKQGDRIVGDLRINEGWPILTDADTPSLRPGEYRLASALLVFRLPPNQGLFSQDLRREIFRRDGYRCWTCGSREQDVESSPDHPFYLVVRHLDAAPAMLPSLAAGTVREAARLATACNRCGVGT